MPLEHTIMLDRILIIEDEDTLRGNLATYLASRGYEADAVGSAAIGIRALAERPYDILITDLYLEDSNGLEILKRLQSWAVTTSALVMTAYGSMDSAIDSFRSGAIDYIVKPFSFAELEQKIENISKYRKLDRENTLLRTQLHAVESPKNIVFASPAMRDVMALVKRVAASRSNVLISGETGTGKELIARALHEFSRVSEGLFVPLNVAAIPEGLVESYLFGHEKGAFTGAGTTREGVFRAAAEGTLFLDEIGDLALPVQAKLLRALEEKEITPVGADVPMKVNTRIVAATHRDLEAMVEQGRFRRDLLMRLSVITIRTPPLRQRQEDILPLTRYLVARHCREVGRPILDIESAALQVLMSYDWRKGNVRELSNVLERAVILCEGETIGTDDLPLELVESHAPGPMTLKQALQVFERQYIARVLGNAKGDRALAARLLGISLSTLYRRLEPGDS
jgi:DNA-binding NtrC family response regulator